MPAIIDYEPLEDCPRGVTGICRKCNQCGRWDDQDPDQPTGKTKEAIDRFKTLIVKEEKEKLSKAVDEWAIEMKEILHEKVEEGYKGWDEIVNIEKIFEKMARNHYAAGNIITKEGYNLKAKRHLLHLCNLAMFAGRFCENETS